MTKGKRKIDGKAMPHSLTTLLEMEMQHEMHMTRIMYPQLEKISIEGQPVIGKIMVFGTGGDMDTNGFENIWKSGNGQRRRF